MNIAVVGALRKGAGMATVGKVVSSSGPESDPARHRGLLHSPRGRAVIAACLCLPVILVFTGTTEVGVNPLRGTLADRWY